MFSSLARFRPLAFGASVGALGALAVNESGLVQEFSSQADAAAASALSPEEWRALKLQKREKLTPNTDLFRFEIKGAANLPVASCLTVRAVTGKKADGTDEISIRPYTPTSAKDAQGHLDLVVKMYADGKMGQIFNKLKPGDSLDFKGPFVKIPYEANLKKAIGLVAGGSGITPCLQVADEILSNPADRTQVSLVFANVSEADIILKDRLDAMQKKHKNFRVHYVVDKASSKGWQGSVGRVNQDVLAKHLPAPSADTLVMVCGPPGFMKAVSGDKKSPKDQGELVGLLKEMGYASDMVFKF